jgi:DNA-binding SARP family transcriptional activator
VLRRGVDPALADEVGDPDLRRARVRELLGFLVGHRRTHRGAVIAALWPDLDDRAGGNNLGVTLNYLLRAFEPWRRAGEPPFLVRFDGSAIELVTGTFLQIDADRFDHHLAEAAEAEVHGSPSGALDHYMAACALYRGDLLADVTDANWLDLERAHYRTRFVSAAGRAAQLLVGHGDGEQAESLAQRALMVDPWNEDAYAVLASTALLRGNRAAARTALSQCLKALDDLGAAPTDATWQLARRCGVATPELASR